MPINIMVGILSVMVALILYSIAIWGAFRARGYTSRTVTVLWAAALFDVLATVMMAIQIGGLDFRGTEASIHTVLALLAELAMVAGAVAATWAIAEKRDDLLLLLSRLMVAPWVVWAGVFVWGMVTRGAARVGG
jgi:hypothetical protein